MLTDVDPPNDLVQVFVYICAMMSNGCCPCPSDMCDCWDTIPFAAMQDVVNYVK